MAQTITYNKNERTLLAPTALANIAAKSVTGITRSGTTATATCTSHGWSTNDWVLIAGSDQSQYNGPFQITNTGTNTFTYVMNSDPGASSAGTVTAQKGVGPTNLWGDGTTPIGSPASIGALATALPGSTLYSKITNAATAPTTAPIASVWFSATGLPGTWKLLVGTSGSSVNATDQVASVTIPPGVKFILIFFYGAATTGVVVEAYGEEVTSATSQ